MKPTFNQEPLPEPRMRTFTGRRRMFERGGKLVDRDVAVMAPSTPIAARIIRERVAAAHELHGPKATDSEFGRPQRTSRRAR